MRNGLLLSLLQMKQVVWQRLWLQWHSLIFHRHRHSSLERPSSSIQYQLPRRTRKYPESFTKQLKHPSLQHIEATGQIRLCIDYCAHGDVVQWLMEYFHLDQLTITHRRSRYTREMHGWVLEKCEHSFGRIPVTRGYDCRGREGRCPWKGRNIVHQCKKCAHVEQQKSCKGKAECPLMKQLKLEKVFILASYW